MIESAAFVEMAVDARRSLPDYAGGRRLQVLIEATLPRAHAAGLMSAQVTVDDVLLGHRMIYGVIATGARSADVEPAVDRALQLLRWPGEG